MSGRIDTLEVSKALQSFGFTQEQSEGLPRILLSFIEDSAATKADIIRLEAAIRAESSRLEAAAKDDTSRLDGAIAELRSEIRALEHRMTARVYGGQIAAVVATVGALKLFGVF